MTSYYSSLYRKFLCTSPYLKCFYGESSHIEYLLACVECHPMTSHNCYQDHVDGYGLWYRTPCRAGESTVAENVKTPTTTNHRPTLSKDHKKDFDRRIRYSLADTAPPSRVTKKRQHEMCFYVPGRKLVSSVHAAGSGGREIMSSQFSYFGAYLMTSVLPTYTAV